jgi:hypothetical protein
MDISIYYPFNIPFFSDQKFISIHLVNNEDHYFYIYFLNGDLLGDLAGFVFKKETRHYHFPEKSIIAIISETKPNKIYSLIKISNNMTYIYP